MAGPALIPAWKRITGAGVGSATAVTPDDNTDLPSPAYLYVGGAGDVEVKGVEDSTPVVFHSVPAGTILPILVTRVYAASTTATNILALR